MKNNTFFITGIGTDVGKTVVAAIVSELLSANFWKPIQAGDLDNSDSMKVQALCSDRVTVLPEKQDTLDAIQEISKKHATCKAKLENHPVLKEIRPMGTIIAFEIQTD